MRALIRRTVASILLPLAVTGAALAAQTTAASAAAADPQTRVVELTNQVRVKDGCKVRLTVNPKLTLAAQRHSADMARRGYFSHTSPGGGTFVTRARAAGYSKPIGENIAYGAKTPEAVMKLWVNSAPHRRNISNCKAKSIGVGVAKNTRTGHLYWTQVFGQV